MSQTSTKIDSAELTTMKDVVTEFSVANSDDEIMTWTPEWKRWKGYYDTIPELQAVINKKAEYVIGKGYKIKGILNKLTNQIQQMLRISGAGIDSFNSVIRNTYVQAQICGDGFAEKVKDKAGRIINLKPLCPGAMTTFANSKGIIVGYAHETKSLDGTKVRYETFSTDEIFHLIRNRLGDAIHGIGCIEVVENIILMRNEAMSDLKIVFHRYVKPLIVAIANTDDEAEILAFKNKLTKSVENAENMVIPKDTIDKFERISIPQYSTLDPLPWIKELQTHFTISEGVPDVILGSGRETTEASAKMLYVGFQQTTENDQFWLEENIFIQLGWKVEFEFPASILDNLKSDERKDGNMKGEKRSEVKP